MLVRRLTHFVRPGAAAARGRYAALQPAQPLQDPIMLPDYEPDGAYLADTLDCMNPYWPPDAGLANVIDDDFNSQQDRYFPQP
jgi:hypothetical protein